MDQQLRNFIPPFGLIDLLDVLIVAFVLYKLYGMIKDTRAVTLLKGLLVVLVMAWSITSEVLSLRNLRKASRIRSKITTDSLTE